MKIAICDDDLKQLDILKFNMEKYALNHYDIPFEIDYFNNPFVLLDNMEKICNYDILLLDICMPGISGTDIAKQVRDKKEKSEIIFFTTSQDYAVEAFALKAAHYIIKPFTRDEFTEALDRVVEKFNHKNNQSISIKTENGQLRFIDLNEIIYIENFGHIQSIYLKDCQIIQARETLTKLLSMFEEISTGQFICPFKGFIINQRMIKSIGLDQIILKNEKNIPIVKRNFAVIKQQYFNYIFKKEAD